MEQIARTGSGMSITVFMKDVLDQIKWSGYLVIWASRKESASKLMVVIKGECVHRGNYLKNVRRLCDWKDKNG